MGHLETARHLAEEIAAMPLREQVAALNDVRRILHESGPFPGEPVDCVVWELLDDVVANDYNPNTVAPPEMRLLEESIRADGYTQPIVAHDQGETRVVVDGFHRNRVGREIDEVRERLHGFLPVVHIRADRTAIEDRMASTIRHNRARGKHAIGAMVEIVDYLAKKGWPSEKIGKELGMDPDEVLRFRQVGGLAEAFADREFSEAWEMR